MYVSVVVPTFNSAKTICNVLEDLKPVKNVEVIISDDGSTDNTVDEVREYRYKNDFPVTILENEHYGVSYARNQGIHVSKGRYLCFIDSDDRVNSEAFSDIISNVDDSDIISCTEGVPVSKNTDFPIAEKLLMILSVKETANIIWQAHLLNYTILTLFKGMVYCLTNLLIKVKICCLI